MFMNVVLAEPDGPMTATNSPWSMPSDHPRQGRGGARRRGLVYHPELLDFDKRTAMAG